MVKYNINNNNLIFQFICWTINLNSNKFNFLNTENKIDISKMNQFSISINSAYAIFDSKLLTWIPKSENIYYDSFDFISSNPIKFDNLGSKKVSKIFCNNQICHIITDEGLIYSWGNDREKYGVLGLGNNYNIILPTLNTNFYIKKRIIDIYLFYKHFVVLYIFINLYSL